jgi:hypothetical protein
VWFHGGLVERVQDLQNPITTKVVCHGATTLMSLKEEIYCIPTVRDAKADWQMIYYANAVPGYKQNMVTTIQRKPIMKSS